MGDKFKNHKRNVEMKKSIIEEEDEDKGYRESDDEAVQFI